MTGETTSVNFPVMDAYQEDHGANNNKDVFVTKFAPSGGTLFYSTYLGGGNDDSGRGIAVDSLGYAYVTGETASTDFPVSGGAYQLANQGGYDTFVTKLNTSGSGIAYSTYLGGTAEDKGHGIAVDFSGNAYLIGSTCSTDFPVSDGAYQLANQGGYDAFVTRFNPSGSGLAYSTYLGGTAEDEGYGIAVDSNGCAYVTGYTFSTDFPNESGFQRSNGGSSDAFVAVFLLSGRIAYSTYLGGTAEDKGYGIAVDSKGCAYLTGFTDSTDFPVEKAYQSSHGDTGVFSDAFVTKFNSSGSGLAYSTYLGGTAEDKGYGIAVDSNGCAYLTGFTSSANFPTKDPIKGACGKLTDVLAAKLSQSGGELIYSTRLGGDAYDFGYGIAVDSNGCAYLTGYAGSEDFPVEKPFRTDQNGSDVFVTKISADVPVLPVAVPLYFPHIETNDPWQTEIALINTSASQTVAGALKGFSNDGQLTDTVDITLSPHGRKQIDVAAEFTGHTTIGYIVFETESDDVRGYTKFSYQDENRAYRAAIPAVSQNEINTSDIYVSHIASNADWWTGLSLVNTTSETKNVTITFNDGRVVSRTLGADAHDAFKIADLFDGHPQPDIQSAVIANAGGIIGLELFGGKSTNQQLDGLLITDDTDWSLYYPHVASDSQWWTGIVVYNPNMIALSIAMTSYDENGKLLNSKRHWIDPKANFVKVASDPGLALYEETAWLHVHGERPVSGFELFGTNSGSQLAPYAGISGEGAREGVFPKIETNGWTAIAFVNTEAGAAAVTLTAYKDEGSVVAVQTLTVNGHAKKVGYAEDIFSRDIGGATYITYSSDKNVVGFQLNGSSDGTMLDGLPAL